MHEERRKYERYEIITPADVRRFQSILECKRVNVTNISNSGLSFHSGDMFSKGESVVFDFEPGNIIVRGTVKWVVRCSDFYCCGVEFNKEALLKGFEIDTVVSNYLH